MKSTSPTQKRHGAIAVLTAVLLVFMVALVALGIDIGYLLLAKTELQHAADTAALAAAADLIPDDSGLSGSANMSTKISLARDRAVEFAADNRVRNVAPVVDPNTSNNASGDVVIGYLANPSDPAQTLDRTQLNLANAAQVRVRRTAGQNGEVGLFFARVMGLNSFGVEAVATAARRTESFSGFKVPDDGSNLMILPIALNLDTWNGMLKGIGSDRLGWDEDKGLTHKGDKVVEMELYPDGTTPGNFGTVDIGTLDNSTSDIARQILEGISPQDMAAMPNGKIALNSQGELHLNGDTGISASIQNELKDIIGEPRTIPIYKSVAGPGDNAIYTIVQFVGIRVMAVQLTGAMKLKSVTIQPAYAPMKGGIGGGDKTSQNVYSYGVWLVR